nr:hypothetical protein CFP56_50899 [Quercus suber]
MSSPTAILLLDPYNDFLHPEGKLYPRVADSLKESNAIANMQQLLKFARERSIPVFYCLHQQTHAHVMEGWRHMNPSLIALKVNKVFEAGTWGAEYFEGMAPDLSNGDVVVSKHWNSRWEAVARLREQGFDERAG